MKKNFLTFGLVMLSLSTFAQVGINTATPNATLDVVGSPSETSKFDGVIPPRITGDQLTAKTYTTAQTGAIVYATEGVTTTPSIQTTNVTSPGTYYFDGTRWIQYTPSSPYMSASVIAKSNGVGVTPPEQGDWACAGAFSLGACGHGSNDVLLWENNPASAYCYDDYGLFDAASNSFKIKESGVYEIKAQLIFYGTQVGANTPSDNANVAVMAVVTHPNNSKDSHLMGTQPVMGLNAGAFRVANFTIVMKLKVGDKIAPYLNWVYSTFGSPLLPVMAEGGYLAIKLPSSNSQGGTSVDSPATFQIRKL